MIEQLAVVAVLAVHGLIHLGFVSPRPVPSPTAPPWPFDLADGPLARSGRITAERLLSVGRTLVLAVLVGYALAILGALGIMGGSAFPAGVAIGSVASLALLLARAHPWLVLGMVVDVALLVLVAAGWRPA